MNRFYILPYRQGSKSARALAHALGGRVLRLQGSVVRLNHDDKVINWGNTEDERGAKALNQRVIIRSASNKRFFFQMMKEAGAEYEASIPPFWTEASSIPDDAFPIVCRTVLAGHSGEGITIADTRDDLVAAPLYVKYINKADEYRIHAGLKGGDVEVISVQRKARRHDTPDSEVNWKVRNHHNGFVYVRGGVNPPRDVVYKAKNALRASGLDFGAVDVIWNAKQERAYVLEINTAPGLEGQTVGDYSNFFKGL